MKEEMLTQLQAAAVLRVTARRLRQMDNEPNPPPKGKGGKYPASAFGEWFEARLTGSDPTEIEYAHERARLTKFQADKTELEVAELRGSLIRVQAVIDHWQQKIGAFRARLLSLPSKLAPQIAAPDKLIDAQDRAQALVYEALIELACSGVPDDVLARNEAQRMASESTPAHHTN